ncbi:MAG: hypothetical protein DSZ00_04475 [Gammaproteobacteria bacterium]|nr:MAG: hypothetical protein DSZ02_08555 [Gammaproteobacteria bacterium]RTZ74384.1 MAG: hypothetical protein DSZ00_04475 [Gammaproteobacteria bacterium]
MHDDADSRLVELLCQGRVAAFNEARAGMEAPSIRGADLCAADLRELDARNLDMRDCHLRRADLRGLDLSTARLEGCSLAEARVSGALFPADFSAEELNLSLSHGTRLRRR